MPMGLGSPNELERLSFEALNRLHAIIPGPEDRQLHRREPFDRQRSNGVKLVQRVASVARLFKKFALRALCERFASFAVSAWEHPQTCVRESGFVVAMLEQRCSIGSEQGDAADPRVS
jgi:hypothetical protein